MAAQNQPAYRHLFSREIEAKDADGLVFKLVNHEGKLNEYDEVVAENADQSTSIFGRSIKVTNARGIQMGLQGKDNKGKFGYLEKIEFERTQQTV